MLSGHRSNTSQLGHWKFMITDTEFSCFVYLSMIIRLIKHMMNKRNLIGHLNLLKSMHFLLLKSILFTPTPIKTQFGLAYNALTFRDHISHQLSSSIHAQSYNWVPAGLNCICLHFKCTIHQRTTLGCVLTLLLVNINAGWVRP